MSGICCCLDVTVVILFSDYRPVAQNFKDITDKVNFVKGKSTEWYRLWGN